MNDFYLNDTSELSIKHRFSNSETIELIAYMPDVCLDNVPITITAVWTPSDPSFKIVAEVWACLGLSESNSQSGKLIDSNINRICEHSEIADDLQHWVIDNIVNMVNTLFIWS
jgi:hypothetical protein